MIASITGNNLRILEMLQEDLFRGGTVVESVTESKFGTKIEYKQHPFLHSLPKLIQNLSLSFEQQLITPKAKKQMRTDEEAARGIGEMFKNVGGQLARAGQRAQEER